MTTFWTALQDTWEEMEQLFRKGEYTPQQEADVQVYLYHGLLMRLKNDGIKPKDIKVEHTFQNVGRADLTVSDRLLIGIKLLWRKGTYHKGWEKKIAQLTADPVKLKGYSRTI